MSKIVSATQRLGGKIGIVKCINCSFANPEDKDICPNCGFDLTEEKIFYEAIKEYIDEEPAEEDTPWRKSARSGTFAEWTRLHIPIIECINSSGSVLDTVCGNGFLLECLMEWGRHKDLELIPFGLEYSLPVKEKAKLRHPQYPDNFFHGNAWEWVPPQKFNFVLVDLVTIPIQLRQNYVEKLLDAYVVSGGRLIVSHNRNHHEDLSEQWITDDVGEYGFKIELTAHGFNWKGLELSRAAAIKKD